VPLPLPKVAKLAWPRWREVVLCTPDDGCGWHPKHVEWTCRIINRLLCIASRWTIINILGETFLVYIMPRFFKKRNCVWPGSNILVLPHFCRTLTQSQVNKPLYMWVTFHGLYPLCDLKTQFLHLLHSGDWFFLRLLVKHKVGWSSVEIDAANLFCPMSSYTRQRFPLYQVQCKAEVHNLF